MSTVLYRVERAGSEELGPPVSYRQMIRRVKALAPREREGSLRIVRCEYNLNPFSPPTPITDPQARVWKNVVLHFPKIGTAGTFVCKASSQHRFGNATDWTAPSDIGSDSALIKYLWGVFEWLRKQGINGTLPVSELIFRDRIATAAHAWTIRPYTGTFHATHVHDSASPLIDTSRPCGAV